MLDRDPDRPDRCACRAARARGPAHGMGGMDGLARRPRVGMAMVTAMLIAWTLPAFGSGPEPQRHAQIPVAAARPASSAAAASAPAPSVPRAAAAGEARRRDDPADLPNAVADAATDAQVHAALGRDPHLRGGGLQVDTVGGRVVLRGSVPDAPARASATDIAAGVPGVRSVDNELKVRPGAPSLRP